MSSLESSMEKAPLATSRPSKKRVKKKRSPLIAMTPSKKVETHEGEDKVVEEDDILDLTKSEQEHRKSEEEVDIPDTVKYEKEAEEEAKQRKCECRGCLSEAEVGHRVCQGCAYADDYECCYNCIGCVVEDVREKDTEASSPRAMTREAKGKGKAKKRQWKKSVGPNKSFPKMN